MKKITQIALFFICFTTLSLSVRATHIAGGEVFYKHLRDSTYLITLKIYIDCENGSQSAINTDRTAYIGYYNAETNDLIGVDEVDRTGPNRIRETNYSCVLNQPSACVDEYTYEYEKIINPGSHGIVISFQRCCRNNTTSNLLDPDRIGATYTATIPPITEFKYNSSPQFNKLPPNFLCKDAPLVFNHGATDIDGDSLVYSITVPLTGASRTVARPTTPQPPPYSPATLINPYTVQNIMGGSIRLWINDSTGELRVTPDKEGQYAVGILVQEYRNGRLVSEVLRDYQFNVFQCDLATQANFINPSRICNDSARFTDLSKSVQSYHWDFGVEGVDNDTSDKAEPLWLYKKEGNYKIQLIVGNGTCKDTFFNYISVIFADSIFANFITDPDTACGSLLTQIENKSDATPDWIWEFGDGTPPLINANPTDHFYADPGTYFLKLTIQDSLKCNIIDTYTDTIVVHVEPVADFIKGETLCDGVVEFENTSRIANIYQWDVLGTTVASSTDENPTLTFDQDGTYKIRLISSNSNCSDTIVKDIPIVIVPTIDASMAISPTSGCLPLPVNIKVSRTKNDHHFWQMGDGSFLVDTFINRYTYTKEGIFTLKHTVIDSFSCNLIDSAEVVINTKTKPLPLFDYTYDPCTGEAQIIDFSKDMSTYHWQIGPEMRSSSRSPSWKMTSSEVYQIALTGDSGTICPSTYVLSADLPFSDLSGLFIPNVFTPGKDGFNDCYFVDGVDQDCYALDMQIYNRWGDLIYEKRDIADCWRGETRYTHRKYPSGVYFSRYVLTNRSTAEETVITGTITLIR